MSRASQKLPIPSDVPVAALAAASYLLVFWISKSLITTNSDFRGFILSSLHSRDAEQFLPGATADFQRSLGISEYPVGLVFDWPWLLATSVPPEYFQSVFAGITCMSLYLAVNLLGARLEIPPFQRQIAGFILPILMFVPGPFMWNSIALYTASFGWTVSVLTIALVVMSRANQRTRAINSLLGLAAGTFVFWGNSSYLPMTLPTVLAGIGFCVWSQIAKESKVKCAAFGLAMLCSALFVLPLFIGTYLFGVWSIPDIAVQENIDSITSWSDVAWSMLLFPGLESLPFISNSAGVKLVRLLAMLLLLFSILQTWRSGRHRLATLGLISFGSFEVYAILYSVTAKLLSREMGLDPSYLEIIGYPLWLLLVVNRIIEFRKFHGMFPDAVLGALPVIIILIWGLQWTFQNYSVRAQPAEYPILQSDTTRELISLTSEDLSEGDFSRVIILQNQFPDERATEGFRIRRASDFSYSFVLELQAANVPVLNAYSHMISPRAFTLTNELFTDGRPTWRQFSLYDKPNVDKMSDMGIRYVLSEVQVTDSQLKLISAKPFKAYGLFPTDKSAYLYEVVKRESHSQPILRYEFEGDEILISGFSSKRKSVSIPIEFSRCLTLSNPSGTSIPNIERGNYGLVNLTFQGDLDVRLRYENSIFQWRNCRILDYLDFRRQHSTQP